MQFIQYLNVYLTLFHLCDAFYELTVMILFENVPPEGCKVFTNNSDVCKGKHNHNCQCFEDAEKIIHVIHEYRRLAALGSIPKILFLTTGYLHSGNDWSDSSCGKFLKRLNPDAICLNDGNFVREMETARYIPVNSTPPIVMANLDMKKNRKVKGIEKCCIFHMNGIRIGVTGYLDRNKTATLLDEIVPLGDEITDTKKACEELIQNGAQIIIVVGSNERINERLAVEVKSIDILIDSRTKTFSYNTLKYTGEQIQEINTKEVTDISAKYLRCLNIMLGNENFILKYDLQPICSANRNISNVREVHKLKRRDAIDLENVVIGKSRVILQGYQHCRKKECNSGNLVADALIDFVINKYPSSDWTYVPIAFINGGSLKQVVNVSSREGNITRSDLMKILPHENTIVIFPLTGEELREAFEHSVSDYVFYKKKEKGKFLQVSGVHILYDKREREGERVRKIRVRCNKCSVPQYEQLEPHKLYNVVTTSYLAKGGDGYDVLVDKESDNIDTSYDVVKAVADYILKYGPIYPQVEHRLVFNGTDSGETKRILKIIYIWNLLILFHFD